MAKETQNVKNAFRDTPEPEVEKTKKTKVKKEKKSENGSSQTSAFMQFLYDGRAKQTLGAFFVLFSLYLFLAFLSYFINWFSWSTDDIFSNISFSRVLFDQNIEVNNWTGRLGAALSQSLIKNGFGLSSFLLVAFMLATGLKWLLNITIINFKKLFINGLFFLVWISLTLGYSLNGLKISIFGGIFGFELSQWFNGFLGKPGTFFLILFTIITYLIAYFGISAILNFFSKAEKDTDFETKTYKTQDGYTIDELEAIHNGTNSKNKIREDFVPVNQDDDEYDQEEIDQSLLEMEIITRKIDPVIDTPEEAFDAEKDPEDDFDLVMANGDEKEKFVEADEISEPLHHSHSIDTEYDPTEDLRDFQFPTIDLLNNHGSNNEIVMDEEELIANKNKIVKTLNDYQIKIEKIKATVGPTITLYEIVPAPGIRISRIKNLEDDIALSLAALGIRIIAPIPGKGTIGIEVPNQNPEVVSMRTILASEKFQNSKYDLPVGMGKTISNETYVFDLAKMPHLLMAGATGQGKSVGLNAIITSLLYKKHPAQLKFVMVDPKKVELTLFSKIERHYLAKLPGNNEAIITDTRDVVTTLNSLCVEMDDRYDLLKDAQVRNIKEYNAKFIKRQLNPNSGHRYLPYIVLVVDEFADLIMTAGKEVEGPIARLAQLARAIGIHLIIATQRPSVNIITGVIKANFPCRIAFRVTSKVDSRTILDSGGADQLIGRGDMLISTGNELTRIQCAFVDTPEVEEITSFIGSQKGYASAMELPEFEGDSEEQKPDVDLNERDTMFADAARVIVQSQHGSTSLIQRKLKLGYNRAGRIMDQLEAAKIVGPFEGSKAREVLIKDIIYLEQYLENIDSGF